MNPVRKVKLIVKSNALAYIRKLARLLIDKLIFPYLKAEDWEYITAKTLPYHQRLRQPVWGPEDRVHLGKGIPQTGTLFNTRSGHIWVGDHTLFSHGVRLITGRHDFSKRGGEREISVPESGYDIRIGSGVFIGAFAMVSGGVTIGDNSVIGMGSVVTRDIPANVFAAGNPARVIREIDFSDDLEDDIVRELIQFGDIRSLEDNGQ